MVEEWIILDWSLASTAASFFATFWAMPKSWERISAKTNLRPKTTTRKKMVFKS